MKNLAKRAIFFDLRNALNTVNEKQLLNVLLDLDFRGPVPELMSSYLSNRSQRDKLGNQLSSWKTFEIGVSQCLVLGPLPFILYINEIIQFSNDLDIILLADDTVLLQNEMNKNIHFQERVNDVVGWLNNKSMTINCKKNVEFFSRSNRSNQATIPPIKIYGYINE